MGLRHNGWLRQTYQRLSGGKKARKKIAIVAVGRKLLVRCWAMLRDNRLGIGNHKLPEQRSNRGSEDQGETFIPARRDASAKLKWEKVSSETD